MEDLHREATESQRKCQKPSDYLLSLKSEMVCPIHAEPTHSAARRTRDGPEIHGVATSTVRPATL
jgi:hypothetical protein